METFVIDENGQCRPNRCKRVNGPDFNIIICVLVWDLVPSLVELHKMCKRALEIFACAVSIPSKSTPNINRN